MMRRLLSFATVVTLGVLSSIAAIAGDVPDRAEDVTPLPVGASAPAFTALTATGEEFVFSNGERTLVIFYRGGWCPYCNRHLQALQDVVPKLTASGVDVLFLSADRPEKLAESLTENKLDYTLLSDASMSASRKFGVAFRVDDEKYKKYKGYGIDLEASSGFDHHQLPVPAVYLIGEDGEVEFMHSNADYRERLSGDAILTAAGLGG
ncbi:MAG: peroxiredoxin-like family protein [Pseudomonadota bacterium]